MRVSGAITPRSRQLLAQDRAAASTALDLARAPAARGALRSQKRRGPLPRSRAVRRLGVLAGTVSASVVCVV